jgi:hypothetical protein
MKHAGPPAWMERLLLFLLPLRDRETVAGDLCEEFCERRAREHGSAGANLWYLLQAISFMPRRCRAAFFRPRGLALLCFFTALCGCWLGAMDVQMGHPGYLVQAGIAAGISLQALLTLGALRFRRSLSIRYSSMLGCLMLFLLAARALIAVIRGAHLEGYVLLIAVALLVQASLTLGTLSGAGESETLI